MSLRSNLLRTETLVGNNVAQLIGYHPDDVFDALGGDLPIRALFTTFTFSPGAFYHQYAKRLLDYGCGNIAVLTDPTGYSQSLFAAAAVQDIGTTYQLRQVSTSGAFHSKLVLIRNENSMIVGVGSGNLTVSGLQTNAEVGALSVITSRESIRSLENLERRLRYRAMLDDQDGDAFEPISLSEDSRLLTSLDAPLINQIELPSRVTKVEIVSPYVDRKLLALQEIRARCPDADIRLRLDPEFGAATDELMEIADERVVVQVPSDPNDDIGDSIRPAVHGKMICFIGEGDATVILGSANLSAPALLSPVRNFETVVEKRLRESDVKKLIRVPRVRWRKIRETDQSSVRFPASSKSSSPLVASLTLRHLKLSWSTDSVKKGTATIWCNGRRVFDQQLNDVIQKENRDYWSCEISKSSKEVLETLPSSCFAEVKLEGGKWFRGWIDIDEFLGLPPTVKRQLKLLDAILTDAIDCNETDVLKFLEFLQRNINSTARKFRHRSVSTDRDFEEYYDDTPVDRALLLEPPESGGISQSTVINHMINRSLDTALRDIRFYGRSKVKSKTGTIKAANSKQEANAGALLDVEPLPLRIEGILSQLFTQLANAFEESESAPETIALVSQVQICIKALAFAVERWIPRSQSDRVLNLYFHKVVVACLAPGVSSTLHRNGALRRNLTSSKSNSRGDSGFRIGVAMLEAYLLLQFQSAEEESKAIIKDMHDVLQEIAPSDLDTLKGVVTELIRIEHGESIVAPDIEQLLDELKPATGEMEGLSESRRALEQLIDNYCNGEIADDVLWPLAQKASSRDKAESLLRIVRTCSMKVRLEEVSTSESACPGCYMTIPSAKRDLLNDTRNVWKCSCGVLLVRSLEE